MFTKSAALERIDLPEMEQFLGIPVRAGERELERAIAPSGSILDLTYADTNRFPPPEWTLETFSTAAKGAGMTYTPYRGDEYVRAAVAQNVREVLGIPVNTDSSVILTPGTQGALFIALASVLQEGDVVLLPDPDYLSTERMIRYFGAEVIRIPILYPDGQRPILDPEALEAAVTRKPRLMVFSHPNNPTGLIYENSTLEAIAKFAKDENFLVLADQLYCRLVYDGEDFSHIAALPGMEERTITLLGPSKTESMSGYRLGVAVAPEWLIERMEDVQSMTALRAPAYAQHLLTRWLADDQDFLVKRVKEYQALRDTTVQKINATEIMRVRQSWGSAYVFPEYLVQATDREISLALKERAGIVVNPGYQFGLQGLGHMRLCFAQNEEIWESALDRIFEVVSEFPLR